MASQSLREAAEQTGVTPETVATNDVAVAFAALQVELTGLLERIAEVRANEGLREDNHENRSSKQLDVIADKADHLREEAPAGTSANAAIDKTETPTPTPTNKEVAEMPRKRSWWRRLVRQGAGMILPPGFARMASAMALSGVFRHPDRHDLFERLRRTVSWRSSSAGL